MADIVISDLSKMYGGKRVLDRVAMHIVDGEFIAVLGPSGCGKTTLLRLLAGFETPDEGTIQLGDRVVSSREANVPPEKRNIGIVFQNYALWPHMSVVDNVGYALKIAGRVHRSVCNAAAMPWPLSVWKIWPSARLPTCPEASASVSPWRAVLLPGHR